MSLRIDALLAAALRVPTPLRWLAVAGWAALIFVLSGQPGLAVSEDPGVDLPLRHVAHVATYALLTALLTWALTRARLPSVALVGASALLALLYGVTDEWHQTFVPTRTGRADDLIWDGLGALIAGLAIGLIVRDRRIRGSRG